MAWLEITVSTDSARIDAVTSALTAGGFSDLVIEDQAEFETFLDQNRAYWDYIDESLQEKLQGLSQIKLYLEDTDNAGMARLEKLLKKQELSMTVKTLEETNWEESWKDNYPPQAVGNSLIVLPYWLSDTDGSGRLPVILDPGLTFGTGAHPSTQMVMENMELMVKTGAACLDLGSGSGILSIAALRLGAASAFGVDIDGIAVDGLGGHNTPIGFQIQIEVEHCAVFGINHITLQPNDPNEACGYSQQNHGQQEDGDLLKKPLGAV